MRLVSEATSHQIDKFLRQPSHGLLLSGPDGAGKGFVARHLAVELLSLGANKLADYPYIQFIGAENGSISIDTIRSLQKFLQLKVPGDQSIRRVVIIEDAHHMTTEAQNALLKALEEPPADTVLILTAPATLQLKETIYSRLQRILVLPVSEAEALANYKDAFSEAEIKKAYLMSGGQTGLLYALLHDQDHQLATEIGRAKQLITAPKFTRLAAVDELAKDRAVLPPFLHACRLICSAALASAGQKSDTKQAKRWHTALTAVYEAEAALGSSPNAKLLLTDLFLNI